MTFRLWVCFYPRLPESHQQSQLTISDSVTNVNHFLSVLLAQSLVKFCQQLVPTIFPTVSRQWQEAVVGDPPSSLRGFHFRCSPYSQLMALHSYHWVLSGSSRTFRYHQVLSGTIEYNQVLTSTFRCSPYSQLMALHSFVPSSTFRCWPSCNL